MNTALVLGGGAPNLTLMSGALSALAEKKVKFYINAYNITDRCMDVFSKQEITVEHYLACSSFPFIYPPCG
jgi:predicted acylesterase/phospholipase RssA